MTDEKCLTFFGATWDPFEYSGEDFIWTLNGPLKLVKKLKSMYKISYSRLKITAHDSKIAG